MNCPEITVDSRVKGELGVFVYYTCVFNVRVESSSSKYAKFIEEIVDNVKSKYVLEELKSHPIIRAYRKFYWRLKLDPTKTRPSSEALLRRVLLGRGFPRINNVVDAGNLASLETLVPIGLYDIDCIECRKLILRFSRRGETFKPIGGNVESLRENLVVLACNSQILHLYPHRDSVETMIRNCTKNVLVLSAGVPGVEESRVKLAAEKTVKYIVKFANGVSSEEYFKV